MHTGGEQNRAIHALGVKMMILCKLSFRRKALGQHRSHIWYPKLFCRLYSNLTARFPPSILFGCQLLWVGGMCIDGEGYNSLLDTCQSSVANMWTYQLVLVEMISNSEWDIHKIHRTPF